MDKISDYIIRPARRTYNPEKDLGPALFTIDHKYIGSRIDFEVKNRRNKTLKCSLFHHNLRYGERHPLIVYCHGNSGNRTYSYEIVYKMLKANISVLTFDFAGCGLSEGKYVFLGYFEQYDIDDVVEYSKANFVFIDPERIGVWGRSMGAVSALMHASRNESLSLIVLDSPFKDLSELLREYINKLKIISSLFGKYIYNKLKRKVLRKSGFDVECLKPIEAIKECKVPAFFFTTNKDKVVPAHHSKELYNAYPGEKKYLETKGNHNSKRGPEVYDAMAEFIESIFARKQEIKKELLELIEEDTTSPNKLGGSSEEKKGSDNDNSSKESSQQENILENNKNNKELLAGSKQENSPELDKSKGDLQNVPDISDGLIRLQSEAVEDLIPTDLCQEILNGNTITPVTHSSDVTEMDEL